MRTTLLSDVPAALQSFSMLPTMHSACASAVEVKYGWFGSAAGKLQRRHDRLRDDELAFELDRQPRPLRAFGHQRGRGDPVPLRLVADRHRGDAGDEDEVAHGERRRIARRRAALQILMF